jgi:hypothetical protein
LETAVSQMAEMKYLKPRSEYKGLKTLSIFLDSVELMVYNEFIAPRPITIAQ